MADALKSLLLAMPTAKKRLLVVRRKGVCVWLLLVVVVLAAASVFLVFELVGPALSASVPSAAVLGVCPAAAALLQ